MESLCDISGRVTMSDDMLRFIVWIVADGTLVDESKYAPGSTRRRVQFKLSRPEKISRLTELLTRMAVPHTVKPSARTGVNKLQPYAIRIYGDWARAMFAMLGGVKRFPECFRGLSHRQTFVVLQTIAETDGQWRWRKVGWTTTSKEDVETVRRLCWTHGLEFQCREKDGASGFKKNCKRQYHVRVGFGELLPKWTAGLRRNLDRLAPFIAA